VGPEQTTREWLESLDPIEFLEITAAISDIQRDRQEARRRKLEERRPEPSEKPRSGRYLRLERVKCGKKGCRKCSGEHPDLHGPYWYLYRPKKGSEGRTSEYRRCPTVWPRSSAYPKTSERRDSRSVSYVA
jgi:hypothetical protein